MPSLTRYFSAFPWILYTFALPKKGYNVIHPWAIEKEGAIPFVADMSTDPSTHWNTPRRIMSGHHYCILRIWLINYFTLQCSSGSDTGIPKQTQGIVFVTLACTLEVSRTLAHEGDSTKIHPYSYERMDSGSIRSQSTGWDWPEWMWKSQSGACRVAIGFCSYGTAWLRWLILIFIIHWRI